jgi:hypothetical protein
MNEPARCVTAAPPLPPANQPGAKRGLRSALTPRLIAALALLVALSGATLLFFRDPALSPGLFPPCLWHAATGTACPGCGITRALHHLLHGRIATGLGLNAVGLVIVLATVAVLSRPLWIALRKNRWAFPSFTRRFAWGLFAVGLLWGLLRNLPWEPFTTLAP